LRRRFGPEYDRTVEETGDRRTAERKLAEIARHRDGLDVRPLAPQARADFTARWGGLQAQFVDDPTGATHQADILIADVMRTRGYPESTFEERAELISADRPEVVSRYRQANAGAASQVGGSGTEELRAAFVHYRELFAWLVDDEGQNGTGEDGTGKSDKGLTGTAGNGQHTRPESREQASVTHSPSRG
jgi:hypothetical protein